VLYEPLCMPSDSSKNFLEKPQPAREIIPRKNQEQARVEQQPQRESAMKVEKEATFLDDSIDSLKRSLKRSKKKKPGSVPQVRDQVTIQVEKIMEEGLQEAFVELTPLQKQEFMVKGEKTAMEIRNLLRASRVKVKKVFELLVDWLKMLPGVNRFFIEQEAKIKADRITAIKHHMQ
jgi:hypothetical protein